MYNVTTLCLNGTLLRVDFMDVIMGNIPLNERTQRQLIEFVDKLVFIVLIIGRVM